MGWYSYIKSKVMRKQSSAADVANSAINLLDQGLNLPNAIAIFKNQITREDPSVDISQIDTLDANGFRSYLQNMSGTVPQGLGQVPEQPQGLGQVPEQPQGLGQVPEQVEQGLGQVPEQVEQGLGQVPEQVDQGLGDTQESLSLDDIPEFGDTQEGMGLGDIPDDVPDQGDMFSPQGIDLENLFERGEDDEPVTPIQQTIEDRGAAQDIQEVAEEVPETERRDQFEDMALDIQPEDIKDVEEVTRITQREFSIPTTFKVKDDNLKRLQNKITKMNRYKDSRGQSPMVVRFKTQDGQPSSEPVRYQKEKTHPNSGESFFAEYVDFVLEGEPPNPLGNPVKEVKDPDGTVRFEDVVYQIIGSIQLVWVEGYKPKEEKFKTQEEAVQYAEQMNAKDPTRPYVAGAKNKSKDFGEFFPATYYGDWRTVVDHYPNSPAWKQEYQRGSPLHCDHCGTKKRGASSRRSVYVAIEYPAAQLITESGKPRDPLPEEIMRGKQVWIGTGCVQGQKTALQFLEDLEKFKEAAAGAEKTGRASDAFGGSMSSPKGLLPIMANYLEAGQQRPGRGGNWYKKRYGKDLSPQDFKEFKKYYFGRKRSDMRKAAIEVWEHEQAVEKYPEEIQKFERAIGIYPYLLDEWRQMGSDPTTKPAKPKAPEKPSDNPPPGPKPLPWGGVSEENNQKAQEILQWWRDKQHDPTINYNDLETNEELGASGEKMHNMISVALNGQIDSSFFHYLPDLIGGYNREQRMKQRVEEDRIRTQDQLTRDEGQAHVDNETFNARRIQDQEQAAERAVRQEQLGQQGVTIADITQVPEGGDFTSEFENIGTKESFTGRYSDFKGPDGKTYRVFDKYKQKRRDPKYDFQPGESYILKGKKGLESEKYRNTPLNNVEIVDTNTPPTPPAPPAVEEGITARPGTITPEAIVPEVAPEVAPEAQTERAPVGDTILGDEARDESLQKINVISDYAKNVVETGRTRDTQDEWGNSVPGREMPPEELIPLYLNQVSKAWPKFDKEHFANRLTETYQEHGKDGLLQQIRLIPSLARNMI